jgi:hypothetical protein
MINEPEWVTRAADVHGWALGAAELGSRRGGAGQPGTTRPRPTPIVAQFPRWFTLTILHFAGIRLSWRSGRNASSG